MTDSFSYLLQDLGKIFHLPLHQDQVGACSILLPNDFIIQIQLDTTGKNLFLFSKLAPLPPGRFREEVLKEGLKANQKNDPLPGILAYLEKTNHLILFQSYPFSILNGERLAGFFGNFLDFGTKWRVAVLQGHTHPR
ncbi:MAG TPA: CesT family type III secretion system chaperone [Chlamydiales bacterium]|nr:MAG: hypothetical protein A3F67_07795 [Verrucomicrobia bacterium RIFCSPHIGHO2_12_FULL_41_10]HLB53254.1 CesT family type III secretion system chaperone [Chlamydiales bacterium]